MLIQGNEFDKSTLQEHIRLFHLYKSGQPEMQNVSSVLNRIAKFRDDQLNK
jgi:hypothetical protein